MAVMPSLQATELEPLFGEHATTKIIPTAPARRSHLPITFLGTVAEGHNSAAVLIQQPVMSQKVLLLRQDIEAGIVLKEVDLQSIVLEDHRC